MATHNFLLFFLLLRVSLPAPSSQRNVHFLMPYAHLLLCASALARSNFPPHFFAASSPVFHDGKDSPLRSSAPSPASPRVFGSVQRNFCVFSLFSFLDRIRCSSGRPTSSVRLPRYDCPPDPLSGTDNDGLEKLSSGRSSLDWGYDSGEGNCEKPTMRPEQKSLCPHSTDPSPRQSAAKKL